MGDYKQETIAHRQQRVASMTRQGYTAREISRDLGVTERTIVRDRAAMGVAQPWMGASRMTCEELSQAERLLDDGCSLMEVARTLGRSHATLIKYFPDRRWTPSQVGARAALARLEKRLLGLSSL